MEFWSIDDDGRLKDCGELTEQVGFAEKEFVKPLYEIKTEPGKPKKVLKQLRNRIKTSIEVARRKNIKLVPLGTPLNSGNINTSRSKRTTIQEKIVGENLKYAKRVAGTHIHVEKDDVSSQINKLTALDPALALQNSSPLHQGESIASSSRNQVYRNQCYQEFPKHGKIWDYTETEEDWQARMNKRFSEFIEAGKSKGVSEEDIIEHFNKSNALWTPVRLREDFPTVEYRSLDVTTFSEFEKFFKEFITVVDKLENGDLPKIESVKNLSKQAIKEGLTPEVSRYLKNIGFKPSAYNTISSEINQRTVSLNEARELRLNYADRLEEDVK